MPRQLCQTRRSRLWRMVALGLGLVLTLGDVCRAQADPDAMRPPARLSFDDSEMNAMGAAEDGLLAPPQRTRGVVDENDMPISGELLQKPLAGIVIEGNETIPEYTILNHIRSREKRVTTETQIEEDVKSLSRTRFFFVVKPVIRMSDAGPILVFQVKERPILNGVEFRGNKKLKSAELEAHTGLIKGHAFDVATNRECVERIKTLYRDKGYRHAKVKLVKGGHTSDRDVIIEVEEGARSKVWGINFEGNSEISSAILKTKLESKRVILWWIGGDYDPIKINSDCAILTKYYNDLGYFDAKVISGVQESPEDGKVYVTFRVEEGMRYKVRQIEIDGNSVVSRSDLQSKQSLKPRDYFNARFLRKDVEHMKSKYDELGRLFAKVQPTPRFLETPGEVDLVYQINEDKPYLIGSINVHVRGDHPHSQEYIVRNQVNAFLKPGHLASGEDVKLAINRVRGSAFWDKTEQPTIDVQPASAEIYRPLATVARGQSGFVDEDPVEDFILSMRPSHLDAPHQQTASFGPDAEQIPGVQLVPRNTSETSTNSRQVVPASGTARPTAAPNRTAVEQAAPQTKPASNQNRLQSNRVSRPRSVFADATVTPVAFLEEPTAIDRAVASSTELSRVAMFQQASAYSIDPEALFSLGEPDLMVVRAQSPEEVYRGQSIDQYGNPVPQNYFGGVSPQGDPFGDAFSRPPGEPGYVDVNIDVTEGRTGRLMFGVGVNSDAGVIGQFTLQEDNFDITRPPRSWADIVNGQAFRGRGQSFRLEAMPGNQVSRYMVSWSDPFFMQTDYNLGVSGFFYNRFYSEWTEDRLGGRISMGRLLTRYWSLSTALRLENVDIHGFNLPAPQDLIDVRGDNFLSTGEIKLTHDSRDSAFMPSYGHLFEVSYEQGFGEFTYPRAETAFSQYFTIFERPDGFGKHILSMRTQLGWTGDDTPIFERYYAGGYSSFRGFAFRGVTPRDTGYRVGGNFMSLSTVEYMAPITADDNIRLVGFTDFGTIDSDVSMRNFRLSVGMGVRLTIPAMGPAPIALDFAVPLMDEEEDNRRVFSFYVGFTN